MSTSSLSHYVNVYNHNKGILYCRNVDIYCVFFKKLVNWSVCPTLKARVGDEYCKNAHKVTADDNYLRGCKW